MKELNIVKRVNSSCTVMNFELKLSLTDFSGCMCGNILKFRRYAFKQIYYEVQDYTTYCMVDS